MAQKVLDTRNDIEILDSRISYLDTGVGDNAVVFLHGNPTSAFLWRNVIPHVSPVARCLAPDLIGMGHSGKEPNLSYKFADHYRYVSAWIEAMKLPKKFTIVCHEWGSVLGLHWCNVNRHRVQAIVFMEALIETPTWVDFPEELAQVFLALRSNAGEDMILKQNLSIERLLPGGIMRTLSDIEMEEYRRPYMDEGESRRPTLTWSRELPIGSDGPKDLADLMNAYHSWLKNSRIPKLNIAAEPGFWSKKNIRTMAKWPKLESAVVNGMHFMQEDSPDEIGQAIATFVGEVYARKKRGLCGCFGGNSSEDNTSTVWNKSP